MKKIIIILFTFLMASCGSIDVPLPVGIGLGSDKLKGSPCACLEVNQQWDFIQDA